MDPEKSSNSSFEDLSNINVGETAASQVRRNNSSDFKGESLKEHESNTQVIDEHSKDVDKDEILLSQEEDCDILGNGQIIKRVIIKSKIAQSPLRGELATISFTGTLINGTVVENEKNFLLHIGDFEVVHGLDMAIPLMNVGETAEIIIDPRFAYGSMGLKNEKVPGLSIPPNAKITYIVEVIDSKREEPADLKTFAIRKKYGTRKKERANFWYNRNEYNTAIQLYRRALDFLDDRDGDPDSDIDNADLPLSNCDLHTLLDERLIVYNNMAMTQIKISAFDAALASVENVLRCQPNNSKALYRKGRALEGKGDTKGAIKLLQRAATLEPETKVIQQDLAKLFIKARREEHNEKEMYQKMLGQAKKLEMRNHKVKETRSGSENSKLKILGYLMGSILIGVAGVAIYRYKY